MKRVFLCLFFPVFAFSQQRANIIYIMSDDHDASAISAYNKTLVSTPNIDRIANEGILFNRSFVGNSICGPARATILTGLHSHKNGFTDNRSRFDGSQVTVPKLLQQAGYQTAVVGKWHLSTYPTGFDFWNIVPGQGQYFEPAMISMKGDTSRYHGYGTDVITDEALGWLRNKRDSTKPFFLMLHHKAPHRYFFPPLKYIQQYHTKTFPEPASLYIDTAGRGAAWRLQTMSILPDMKLSSDLKVDPAYLMDIPWLKPDSAEIAYYRAIINRIPAPERKQIVEIYKERGELIQKLRPQGKALLKLKYQWYMQDYLACVASVDENVGRVLDYLDASGLARNTLVIYTSDQGFYLGQNGWFDKRWMYDVSMRSPLLARWPGHIKPGTKTNTMVQNIDYAPTFLDVAGVKIPAAMQGLSLKGVLQDPAQTLPRNSLYYHFYEYKADHTVLQHVGVRTDRYKLLYFYTVNEWQLFDLQKDKAELNNLVGDRSYQKIFADMKKELLRLRDVYDDHEAAGELR
ncbi:sulfatase [Sediminibacterium roseum]|uniref:Sulfatase n=1 Tax=Sediminibacterium roseum TaxID=1978412 RepID=A0ABW9ZRS6_9BACT|nr:sulfatase [Sediminibacterium roseum]NCI48763.1 sulfatase [Sediminibacterium roseum]